MSVNPGVQAVKFMIMLSNKPNGSMIEVQNDFNQTKLYWKNPRNRLVRYSGLVFLIPWMGGWVIGEAFAVRTVIYGQAQGLLLPWLTMWTIAGIYFGMTTFQLARPTRPEMITLDPLYLLYDSGTYPIAFMSKQHKTENPLAMFKLKKLVRVSKKDISNLKIDRIGERQRLSFDFEAKRIEIGKYLSEPEREWLLGVLQSWQSA